MTDNILPEHMRVPGMLYSFWNTCNYIPIQVQNKEDLILPIWQCFFVNSFTVNKPV